jgi:ABC-2 type transport system ATP-binding protein
MGIIEIKNLNKTFRTRIKNDGLKAGFKDLFSPETVSVPAVNDVSFEVGKGEMLAFIGPNGAGKSTTIKILTGIMYPDSGLVSVMGLNPSKQRKELSYRIGSVFGQKSQLWFHLPVMDSFKLLGAIFEIEGRDFERRIGELIEIFEIRDHLKTPVRKLSLGERIRCELCASLIHKPEVIFLDEPTIGLDVVIKHKIRELIKRLNSEDKVTVFLTSHDVDDIERICNRAIIINHGKIVLDESVKNLKYRYLKKKMINIRYACQLNMPPCEGVEIIKKNEFSMKLEADLDRTDLHGVLKRLVECGDIVDMTIEEKPLEEIIKEIYSTQNTPSTVREGGRDE